MIACLRLVDEKHPTPAGVALPLTFGAKQSVLVVKWTAGAAGAQEIGKPAQHTVPLLHPFLPHI